MTLSFRIGTTILLLGLAVTCADAKIIVEYDREADLESYRTYAWKKTPSTSLDEDYPDIHIRIVKGVEYYLVQADLKEDEEDPDLWVTYHARTNSELRVDTNQVGYMYGNGWFWDPNWGGAQGAIPMTGHLRTYRSGTFILDIVDARSKEIIWRGTSQGKLADDRDKLKRNIDNTIRKMVSKWKRMYKGQKKK